MRRLKASGIYGFLFVFSYGLGVPFCGQQSDELDFGSGRTLCDSSFCVCNDPYGRVSCRCPAEVQVEDVIVRSNGPCSVPQETSALAIDNCDNVTVIGEAFADLKGLQSVTFADIRELKLESNAFRSRGHGLSVNVTNVTVVPEIPSYAFSGRILSVSFVGCYVGMIRAFAFSSIESAESVIFRGTNVANVEAQAFKKFPVSKFQIVNSQFNLIPSRFVFDVEVDGLFKMDGTFVDTVKTAGFKVNNPKVTMVTGNRINAVHSEAFRIRTAGDVIIRDNRFNSIEREAFRGFSAERYLIVHVAKPKFIFHNNSVVTFEEKSFFCNRTSFEPIFSRVMIEESCSCDGLVSWRDMIREREATAEKSIEDDVEAFWCHVESKDSPEYASGREFYRAHCATLTNSIFFFVIIISATAISLVLIILFIVCFVQRRKKKWNLVPGTDKEGAADLRKCKSDGKTLEPKAIIVPDGRTYRETEFHVIVEKAEPLEVGYTTCKVVRDRSRSQVAASK